MLKHHSSWVRLYPQTPYARLSSAEQTETCIVFVHGFLGNNESTWGDFPDQSTVNKSAHSELWSRSDLYFYDYGAERDFVKSSANGLSDFLKALFPKPEPSLFGLSNSDVDKIRSPWKPYRSLILVGHSLGAVVVRECIENTLRPANPDPPPCWVNSCKIKLFAPAHIGFHFSGRKELLYRLAPRFFTAMPAIWRAFNDLQKNSTTLKDLRTRTEGLAAQHPQVMASILFGTKEDVVEPGEFDCDPRINWERNHDHTSVCKPSSKYVTPFDFVMK